MSFTNIAKLNEEDYQQFLRIHSLLICFTGIRENILLKALLQRILNKRVLRNNFRQDVKFRKNQATSTISFKRIQTNLLKKI